MAPYSNLCDDFGVLVYLNTELALPTSRESVLHYFETIKKAYPQMNNFVFRDGEYSLDEDKETGSYRVVTLEPKRICSGFTNPPSIAEADRQHLKVLEIAPFHFDINGLDMDALDVVFSFDLIYSGNHDEVVAEALGLNSSLESLLELPNTKVVKFEPSVMLALDETLNLQCRLNIETRTTAYQLRSGEFDEEALSVYFTVRQYWQGESIEDLTKAYTRQRKKCQELVDNHVIPSIIQPLAQVIDNK